MGIPYTIKVGDSLDEDLKQTIENIINDTFLEIDLVYNNWNARSEISKINQLAAFEKVAVSPGLYSLLENIDKIYQLTEGRFDPTIEPIERMWKTHLRQGKIPSTETLKPWVQSVGWRHIHLEEGCLWKDHALTAIDLGGISKGYCVDMLVERLTEMGISNLFVEWGGEVRAQGHHPKKRPWHVAIAGMTSIDLEGALATSGDYFQCWEVDGVTYTHIIDPMTCQPLQKGHAAITSTSVKMESCAYADAFATALMLFSSAEEGKQWVKTLPFSIETWISKRN